MQAQKDKAGHIDKSIKDFILSTAPISNPNVVMINMNAPKAQYLPCN